MPQRVIKRYGHLKNVNWNDFILKNKQRFYRAHCVKCSFDRGYIEPRHFNRLCLPCTKTKHSNNFQNVNFNDFIKEKYKPVKYRMSCIECGADKGYKPIAYNNRRCYDCSDKYISKIKTKTTPQHRKVRHAFSVSIYCRLNNRGSSKSGNSTFNILGYSFEDLVKHLESQFEPWMNWDNYGVYDKNRKTWQIDHIKPDSSFNYSSTSDAEFKESWKLSNLRPLDVLENILKSDNE